MLSKGDYLLRLRFLCFNDRRKFGRSPTLTLGFECGLLRRLEFSCFRSNPSQEIIVIAKSKCLLLNVDMELAFKKAFSLSKKLRRRNRIEADLIEKPQQPWFAEVLCATEAVPDLNCPPDELVTAWSFHSVDAKISTTDADRILRGPGTRRVVFRCD